MIRKHALLFLLLLAAAGLADIVRTTIIFNVNVTPFTNVSITDVTLSASPLYQGASTDIFVTLENIGTVSANVSVNVSIYNSIGGFIQNITYSPAIVPPSSTLTISGSWSTGSNPVGTYYANASGRYESGTNSTNVFSRQFTISAAPTPTPTPGTGGGSVGGAAPGEPTPLPTEVPSDLKPVSGELAFLKSTVLREVAVGNSVFESLLLKNLKGGSKSINVNITGVPSSWFSFTPTKSILLPSEERAINIGISVPNDARPGDYLIKIEVSDKEQIAIDYMLLRVKAPTRGAQFPIAQKIVRLDRPLGATIVTIEISNPTTKTIPFIEVKDELLAQLKAGKDDIFFADKPGEIIQTQPLQLRWRFRELQPLEKVRITYTVYALLQEYRPYIYWSVKQTEVAAKETKLTDIVSVREISSTPIAEGSEGTISASIFYAGFEPVNFKATLEVPNGFTVEPLSVDAVLQPRGTTPLSFKLKAPRNSAGTHLVTLSILLEDEFLIQQTGFIEVQPYSFALSAQMTALLEIFAAIVIIFSVYSYLKRKREKRVERRSLLDQREGYLKQLKRVMLNK